MESYQRLIDVIAIENLQMRLEHWLLTQVLVWSTLGQVGAILAALGLAYLARPAAARAPCRASPRARASTRRSSAAWRRRPGRSRARPSRCSSFVGAYGVASRFGWPSALLTTAINLIGAWIVIRLITRLIRNDFWSRVVAVARLRRRDASTSSACSRPPSSGSTGSASGSATPASPRSTCCGPPPSSCCCSGSPSSSRGSSRPGCSAHRA